MVNIKEESKYLASLSVFRDLYDKQKDIYGVICTFLEFLITSFNKYSFNLSEITNLLNSTFEFNIPEAVVNTSLRRLNYLKKSYGSYTVTKMPDKNSIELNKLQDQIINDNMSIFENIITFIETEKQEKLGETQKGQVVQDFCSFLLDDSNRNAYSDYISGFIINNKSNVEFKSKLNKIREGVILYSGLLYTNNLGDLGSWKTELTLYLDTEILFHFAGYNGSLYKTLFLDFFNLVKEINYQAKRKLVSLKFFGDVKREIDVYFNKAEFIVEGKDNLNPTITAMSSLVDGCHSPSDIVGKKTDFYLLLKNSGILQDEDIDFSNNQNYKFNFIDQDLEREISKELGIDISENIKFLNYINVLRKNNNSSQLEDIGFILLTGNLRTISLAYHEDIKPISKVPLATTLDWITNKFWFQLNRGFGDGIVPSSFDIITKAQILLSSIIDKTIGEKYDNLLKKFKEGEITESQAKARILNLRTQVRKPEEINQDEISSILDILSRDSLENFIKEQEQYKHLAAQHAKENKKLKQELKVKSDIVDKHLKDKIDMFNLLAANKSKYEKMALQKFNRIKIFIGTIILFYVAFSAWIIYRLSWEILEGWTYLINTLFPFAFTIIYLLINEKSWDLKKILDSKKRKLLEQKFEEFNFNVELFSDLQKEVSHLILKKE